MRQLMKHVKTFYHRLTHLPVLWQMNRERQEGKTIIAYQLSSAGQLQYMLPLHHELKKTNRPFSYYVSMDYPMQDKITELGILPSHCFLSDVAKYLHPIDIFLEAEIHSRGPQRAIKIFSGHGQANKLSHWAEDNLKAFDVYFLHGPLERQMFEVVKSSKPEATNHIELIDVGYPKLDALVNKEYDRSTILSQLGLDPNLKTVLYAPAWDPGGSLRQYGTAIVDALLSIPDINVIVKLHPASMEPKNSPYWEFYTGGMVWEEVFSKIRDSRFCFVKDYLINPYLFVSDLMVNDFSGVGLEFMVLDRPVIYIDCPDYFEKTLPAWRCDGKLAKEDDRFNGGRNAGVLVTDLESLRAHVIQELENPHRHSQKRQLLSSQLMYHPGRGAKTGCDAILAMLDRS